MLNVVNFGGGTYVLYAEIAGDEIEVDPDTYGDNFARPARLLPLEAKALVAAIDLFGDHLPQAGLQTRPREDRRRARPRPLRGGPRDRARAATTPRSSRPSTTRSQQRRVLELHYYKENEDEFIKREVEPYQLVERPGGLVPRLLRPRPRGHPPLPARPDEGGDGRPARRSSRATGSRSGSPSRSGWSTARSARAGVARVWVSPERARWLREERTVVEELSDGAVVVELPYGSTDWLVREILKGVGDLVVLEPDDAREAVLKAVAASSARWRWTDGHRPGTPRDRPDRRAEPGADDARGHQHLRRAARDPAYVIDPGPDDAGHIDAIRAAAESARRDRRRAAHPLARRPLRRGAAARRAARSSSPTATLEACRLATPGPRGRPRLLRSATASASAATWSSARARRSCPPDGGSLRAYLDSLAPVQELDLELLCPGHGPWVTDPAAKIERVHRPPARCASATWSPRSMPASARAAALLDAAWDDVPEPLRPAAALAMQAHLEKLDAEGRLPDRLEA